MIKPITPNEVVSEKALYLPDEVFEVVNRLIAKHWSGAMATIKQDEIIESLIAQMDIDREEVFARKLLDFETVYRSAGWKVRYDKPAYDENYDAFFQFSKAK